MTRLPRSSDGCNVAEALARQLSDLFGDCASGGSGQAVFLHGSILDPENWGAKGDASDVDLLIVDPRLSRARLDEVYARLSVIELLDRPVVLEKRVGPICSGPGGTGAVTLQVAVLPGVELLSPVTLQILDLGAREIVGERPPFGRLAMVGARMLDASFAGELGVFRTMMEAEVLPFWRWSERGPLRRVEGLEPALSEAARAKLREYVVGRLYAWALLATINEVPALAGFTPAEMIELAAVVGDTAGFLASLDGAVRGLQKES